MKFNVSIGVQSLEDSQVHAASIHSGMRTHVMHVINEKLLYTLTDDMDTNIEQNLRDELVRTRSQRFLTLLNFLSVY